MRARELASFWDFFIKKKKNALTSSSVHCGRCSATTTILSSLRTVMEKIAILRAGKHAHFELVLSQNHGFDDLKTNGVTINPLF